MSRVLLTGAQGFTARYLTPALQEAGHDVHSLSRPDELVSAVGGSVALHLADLRDADAVKAAVRDVRPEVVIHLAGISHVAHSDVREMYESNVIGSRNLLQALADADIAITSIVLASSANVYGNRHEGRLDENVCPRPVNDYGVSKLAMEHLAGMFSERLPITIVRPFNYTGQGQSSDFIIPKIVDHVRRRAETIELGNLDVERDFSDVRTVVDCYCRLIESPAAAGKTLNICSGRPYALSRIIEIVQQLSGHTFSVRTNPSFVRRTEVKSLYGDNGRLVATIGPMHSRSLEDTLKWMIEA